MQWSGGVSSKTRDRGWKVAVFSAKDGALLHEPTPEEGAVASMTLSEGVVFMAPQHGQGRIQVVDAATGAFRNDLIPRVPGSKCTPLLATPNWLFYRHQAGSGFIRIDRKTKRMYTIHRIRCTCHYPGLPANGLLYVQGPGCNCAHAFRANVALIPGARTPVVPKDPDSRVVKTGAFRIRWR